jgi:glycosyltransferase involved in cell wall biosynthesis
LKGLVLLTYNFPPVSTGGTPAILNLLRYMPGCGWRVLPLTVANPRSWGIDTTLEENLPRGLEVTRVPHRELRRGAGTGEDAAVSGSSMKSGMLGRLARRIIDSYVLVPDRLATWGRTVVPAGVRLVMREKASVIMSRGPHHSLHLHAAKIARRTGIPFVAFFGDLWLADSNVEWPSRINRLIEARMERSVVRRASGIVATTEGSVEYFRKTYGDLCPPLHVSSSGYDPERFPGIPGPHPKGDRMVITYTGNFYGRQTPEPLLEGLELFFRDNPGAPLLMRFAGAIEGECPRRDYLEITGSRSFSEIPALQSSSDVLLAYINPFPGSELKNSSKLAEYLRSGRPILAVAPEGDMTGLVRRFGAGYVCEPSPKAIASTLSTVLDHWDRGCLVTTDAHDEIAEVFDAGNVCARLAGFLADVTEGVNSRT